VSENADRSVTYNRIGAALDDMVDTNEEPAERLDTTSLKNAETDTLREALEAEDNQTRIQAAATCLTLAEENIDNVAPLIPAIVDRLDDERVAVLRDSATALAFVAESRPGLLGGSVGPLVDLLAHDVPIVRAAAAKPIGSLTIERTKWFVPHVEALLDVIEEEIVDPTEGAELEPLEEPHLFEEQRSISAGERRRQFAARSVAANVLIEVSDTNSGALQDHIPRIVDHLNHDDDVVVGACADIIANVARTNPEAATSAVDLLCSLLDSQNDMVRARATRALGVLGDQSAIDPLRGVATDESASRELRDLAADTISWLEQP